MWWHHRYGSVWRRIVQELAWKKLRVKNKRAKNYDHIWSWKEEFENRRSKISWVIKRGINRAFLKLFLIINSKYSFSELWLLSPSRSPILHEKFSWQCISILAITNTCWDCRSYWEKQKLHFSQFPTVEKNTSSLPYQSSYLSHKIKIFPRWESEHRGTSVCIYFLRHNEMTAFINKIEDEGNEIKTSKWKNRNTKNGNRENIKRRRFFFSRIVR